MEAINTTLYINIEYEFFGEIIFNPLIIGQPEGFGSLISSVTTNPNFVDGIFNSFLVTSSLLLVITTATRVIERLAVALHFL